ncbi:Gag-Pol polyprotein [Dictyocoela muelleri]|nr:Gag-Pol polyprotein [Dictyocoela muelleri]
MNIYKIEHLTCAPYNPTGIGIVERVNKEIGIVLRISRGSTLNELRNKILRRINCTNNSSLGYSPFEIFHKKPIFSNSDKMIEVNYKSIVDELKLKCAQRNKIVAEKRRAIEIKEGDQVYVKQNSQDKVERR